MVGIITLFYFVISDSERIWGEVDFWCRGVDDLEDDIRERAVGLFFHHRHSAVENFLEHLASDRHHDIEDWSSFEHLGYDEQGSFFGDPEAGARERGGSFEKVVNAIVRVAGISLAEIAHKLLVTLRGEVDDITVVFHWLDDWVDTRWKDDAKIHKNIYIAQINSTDIII